ncbi:MAG: T9SS type A sorting domain-containing protein [Bacteroidales bacterium]
MPKPALLSAYPNPFYYETHIKYTIPEQGHALLRVFDITGKPAATLMDVDTYPGSGTITWRGKDDFGNKLPQGTYVMAISVNGKEKEGVKVVLGR